MYSNAAIHLLDWLILDMGHKCCRIVRDVDGSNVVKFKHPGTVFGCQWSPSNQ